MKKYSYVHTIGFEETNIVGNVYFANFIKWQGLCREMFLREYAPDILNDLYHDLALITLNCSCEYYDQLFPFDQVRIEMHLKEKVQNRVTMEFLYIKEVDASKEAVIAKGIQEVCVMKKNEKGLEACEFPQSFNLALERLI